MSNMQHHGEKKEGSIGREVFLGLASIALGGFNIAGNFGYVPKVDVLTILSSGVLVIVGFTLLHTAFKLWRFKWHTRRLF